MGFNWSNYYIYLSLSFSLIGSLTMLICMKQVLNIFQLGSYAPHNLFKWFLNDNNKVKKVIVFAFYIAFGINVVFGSFIYLFNLSYAFMLLPFSAQVVLLFSIKREFSKHIFKKPLVVTARVKRLLTTLGMFVFVFSFLVFSLLFNFSPFFGLLFTPLLVLPLIIVFVNYINSPIEKLVQLHYIFKAKKKLKQFPNLIVIGITGSYGKTSTKFILTQILKQKYFTLCTPNSYNTPMGITKTILNDLKPHHEVFVVEMGADHKNDIKKICKIIKPDVAILTSIGAQHLETFKTIQNIIITKNQIMENLKPKGIGFYNVSNIMVKDLYLKAANRKVPVGTRETKYYANSIKVSENGTEFEVFAKGKTFSVQTKLLGEHNVNNLLMCIAVAMELKVSVKLIKKAIEGVTPVKNRLELIKLLNGALILDDSFNSNPQGSAEALRVLKQFTNYKKIVITPGMVELHVKEYEENFNFGKNIGAVADEVYIINYVNKEAIFNGLRASGFDLDKVKFYERFDDAFSEIKQKLMSDHIILIENDLPDNYI